MSLNPRHIKLQYEIKDVECYSFDTRGVKYWIVQRAFDLGYEKDLHGLYDSKFSSYHDRHDNRVERIGKKYQLLVYYEILAVIADNYKLTERCGSRRQGSIRVLGNFI